ncbi:B-cell linker protein-like isoform X2 [Littorina saxatilis]|uniref:B-cell linker protein-like isoform X2 n=1 Tax=Littorina saxatilis TaxID=31220 RepID=UPI0038B510D0
MALPHAEELARWTVHQVNNWLNQSSLSAFRDHFINEGIDGSKLMGLTSEDVDKRYNRVPKKKREVLKDHLRTIRNLRSPPTWNTSTPPLPPRPGGGPRMAPSIPATQDDEDLSDGGWDTDFDGDDDSEDPEEYLEPTTVPPPRPAPSTNGGHRLPPPPPLQSEYEIGSDEEEHSPAPPSLVRKSSIVDRLKNELQTRHPTVQSKGARNLPPVTSESDSDGESYIEPTTGPCRGDPVPPPRPPPARNIGHGKQPLPPLPTETRGNPAPPEDVYEIMSDSTDQGSAHPPQPPPPIRREPPKPPAEPSRPVKKKSAEKPPPQPPVPREQGGFLFNDPQAKAVAPPGDDLSGYPWYHGKISRDQGTKIFEREQKDGMFLIRKSVRDANQPYTLVIWQSNRLWNIPIRKLSNSMYAAGKFKQGETQFNSIVDLVEHFKVVSLSLKSAADQAEGTNKLTIPAPKR